MRNRRPLGLVAIILLLGAVMGTLLGDLIGMVLPDGSIVEEFFTKTGPLGFDPTTINTGLFTFTIGFTLRINVIGIVGVVIAIYLLRWY